MINTRFIMKVAAVPLFLFTFTSVTNAQIRTWVSGVGDDANPCSRTAPCKTFAGAISKTAIGGEIDALDPGGFGALTITKAITLDGGGGQVASVLPGATNGIVVAAGGTDVVTLRNLRINGASGGLNGIRFISGSFLHVENCTIFGFTNNGIDVSFNSTGNAQLTVENTTLTNNTNAGISLLNAGTGFVLADISRSQMSNSKVGLLAQNNSQVSVRDSQISNNTSFGVQQSNISGLSEVLVIGSSLAFDAIAVQSSSGGQVLVTGNTITGSNPVFNQNGGQIYTGGDNFAFSNGPTGATTAVFPKL